jgi:uncharacterized protein (TIGR02453 family)
MSIRKETIDFLKKLKKNNKREWFQENKQEYEKALQNFSDFVQECINETARFEPALKNLKAKDAMFRIYRDVRFSKDKSPYKTHFGAVIAPGGRKSSKPCYYVQISADGAMLAGGRHMPDAGGLKKIRDAIAKKPEALQKILKEKNFSTYFSELDRDGALKTVPRGYAKDHPAAELLKLKSFTVHLPVKEKEAAGPDFLKLALKVFKALKPLNDFLSQAG